MCADQLEHLRLFREQKVMKQDLRFVTIFNIFILMYDILKIVSNLKVQFFFDFFQSIHIIPFIKINKDVCC